MAKDIEVRGLEELERRFARYPVTYKTEMAKATVTSMLVLHENVPPYPPQPTGSTYDRTGTLGRSLGITESGGPIGLPSIFKVKSVGPHFEGRFGTNLHYAPRVIGDRSQQSSHFAQYWWRLEQVIGPSYNKIMGVYNAAVRKLASWLEGR